MRQLVFAEISHKIRYFEQNYSTFLYCTDNRNSTIQSYLAQILQILHLGHKPDL